MRFLTLPGLARYADLGLLLLRLGVGLFLIYGVTDNIFSATRMQEFSAFLARYQFPAPDILAPLSVWVQLAVGCAFVLGLFTRAAGMLCVANFSIAILMVDRFSGIRGAFPSICLVLIGMYLALRGSGRFGIDNRVARSDAG